MAIAEQCSGMVSMAYQVAARRYVVVIGDDKGQRRASVWTWLW